MDLPTYSQLQSQLIEAQNEVIKWQNAAQTNHEKWQEEAAKRHAESLDAVAGQYLCTDDDLRTLIHAFGKLTLFGLKLEHVAAALLDKYPQVTTEIEDAFELE
ncbi:MAG: hypothetical protein E6Q97_07190 [Desulfurellales bacterium]|nr:MAG: hypothetical protein E6Q97_07190 [Desulfurellales bacterium]